MCCKGYDKGKYPSDRIRNYLANECGISEGEIGYDIITAELKYAVIDYLKSADNKESLINNIFDSYDSDFNRRVISALKRIRVRDDVIYINGFTPALISQSEKELDY